MSLSVFALPLAPSLAAGVISAPLLSPVWLLATALVALAGLLYTSRTSPEALRPSLRLVPTANAWGYSERAQLDDSAVGL